MTSTSNLSYANYLCLLCVCWLHMVLKSRKDFVRGFIVERHRSLAFAVEWKIVDMIMKDLVTKEMSIEEHGWSSRPPFSFSVLRDRFQFCFCVSSSTEDQSPGSIVVVHGANGNYLPHHRPMNTKQKK